MTHLWLILAVLDRSGDPHPAGVQAAPATRAACVSLGTRTARAAKETSGADVVWVCARDRAGKQQVAYGSANGAAH